MEGAAGNMPDDLKDLDNLKPIDHAVVAKPHTPVYKMHRYFARRPWSVFRSLIEHYSNPGSIVLDPFCGGGVTVVEGLRLGRKVIGVDLNPLATFVTRCEVLPCDLEQLEKEFERVEAEVKDKINALYMTTCPRCGKQVPADWFEWSNVYECAECHTENVVSECKKLRAGSYQCNGCKALLQPFKTIRKPPVMINVFVSCPKCNDKGCKTIDEHDVALAQKIESEFDKLTAPYKQLIPDDPFPDGDRQRDDALYQKGIRKFADLFTKRNLLANAMVKDAISKSKNLFLWHTFSASLRFTNRMVFRQEGWQSGKPIEWAGHAYWIPEVSIEQNVLSCFRNRSRAIFRGKRDTQVELGEYPREANDWDDLSEESGHASFWLLTQSAHAVPLPDQSVDVLITDPPYGGNVQYLELSAFWVVWIREILGNEGTIDYSNEAIETRHSGFPTAKDQKHYRDMLFKIFKECHRVLKPKRWMVMTFHNREFEVWNAIHLAAHDAGFKLTEHDGMIYQPAIKHYENTMHTRASGSMLGDFILSFQKVEKQPDFKQIEHAEIGRQIERLAAEAVLHHKEASLSLIYMKLMPWLLNNNLLDKISEKELVPYLTNSFEEKDGKWRLKASPGGELKQALEEYSRQHYKASYEELDFVPVEARIEYLIKRLLYARGFATQDDILNIIYENLINSNMAEAREIQQVLSSIAKLMPISQAAAGKVSKEKAGRKVWKLKEDIEREKLFAGLGVDVEYRLATSEESDHDLAIARLVEMAGCRKLKAHIGKTEQGKYTEFRKLSSDLPQRVQGMPKAAREIVEQIDVIWHNGGKGIVAAFEVERTTTITSGIDRFRNLLTAAPESEVELYLVVPKSRGNEVRSKLGSPANRKDGLHKKIGYIYLEDLDIRHAVAAVDFEKIRHFINGGQ
jgi:DNA modification methylase